MSNEWDDLVKKASPREEAAANKMIVEEYEKNRYLEKEIIINPYDVGVWTYERKKFDKMLGWEKAGIRREYDSYVSGEEYVKTSETTFERREKVHHNTTMYAKMRLDKTKFRDQEKVYELDKEISTFLSQAEEKIGKTVCPAFFDNREWISYFVYGYGLFNCVKLSCLISLVPMCMLLAVVDWFVAVAVGLLLTPAVLFLYVLRHRKKNASYRPLIDAYHKKVEEFENEIKQVINF